MDTTVSWKRPHLLDASLLMWTGFAFSYFIFKFSEQNQIISGYLALVGQGGMDLIAAIAMFALWKNADSEDRFSRFYLYLLFSFLAGFLADTLYNFLLNIEHLRITTTIDTIFDIPFTLFLLFQCIAWFSLAKTVHQNNPFTRKQVSMSLIGPVLFFTFFTFSFDWRMGHFSIIGFYHLCHNLLEAFGLYFVTLVLIKLRPMNIRIMCYGYCIILISDISIRYSVIMEKYISLNAFEATWVLGLAFFVIAAILAHTNEEVNDAISFQLLNRFFDKLNIPQESKWRIHCICSKEIDRMMRHILAKNTHSLEDVAVLLNLTSNDYDEIKMIAATDEKTYEALWMLHKVVSSGRTAVS